MGLIAVRAVSANGSREGARRVEEEKLLRESAGNLRGLS